MNRTYCMGYWPLPKNKKRPIGKYKELLPKTFSFMHGQSCVFFSDSEDWLALAESLGKEHNVSMRLEKRGLGSLKGKKFVESYLKRTKEYGEQTDLSKFNLNEKGKAHYVRDYLGSGPEVYGRMLTIWMSKTSLLKEVSEANECEETWWIDASTARIYKNTSRPDISKVSTPPGKISHFGNMMKKNGINLPMLAMVFGGNDHAITRLDRLFWKFYKLMADEVYPNDEECIFARIRQERRGLFHAINKKNTPVAPPF